MEDRTISIGILEVVESSVIKHRDIKIGREGLRPVMDTHRLLMKKRADNTRLDEEISKSKKAIQRHKKHIRGKGKKLPKVTRILFYLFISKQVLSFSEY